MPASNNRTILPGIGSRRSSLQCISLAVMIVLIGLVSSIKCHKIGDAIPMLKRVQYNEKRTQWSEVPYSDAPRFGLPKKITITGVSAILEAFNDPPKAQPGTDKYYEELIEQAKDDLKLAFSFHHPNFETSWITLFSKISSDSKTPNYHFLKQIDFVFVYNGDTIKEIKHSLQCMYS